MLGTGREGFFNRLAVHQKFAGYFWWKQVTFLLG